MKKRIIFDLDNTLIMWKKEYEVGIANVAKKLNIDVDFHMIDKAIDNFEFQGKPYSKKEVLNLINETCNLNLKSIFLDELIKEQKEFSEIDEKVIDTLEYLSNKYDLVVLTNYFDEVQIARLKKADIYKYFSHVYTPMKFLPKPSTESFETAIGNFSKEECIMVGDNIKTDIEGALSFGIDVILYDYNNKYLDLEYARITDFSQLQSIL